MNIMSMTLKYLSEWKIWISFLNYLRWCQQWMTWNQMNHQTCWWSRIWAYYSQLLLWWKQIIFWICSNLMHLSHFEVIICLMFWLFAFEAKFFLKQLFLNEIKIQYSEFLSWRSWCWCCKLNKWCADDRTSCLCCWCFDNWLSIQFSQLNIDLHADVSKLIQICDLFIDYYSLKIWTDLMLKIIQ